MKQIYKTVITLLLCAVMLLCAVPAAGAATTYTVTGAKGEITLPIAGYGPGARSTNCWTFAQTIYKAIWGVNFSGVRGTKDDLLRDVPAGSARAITTENTRAFLSEAALGAVIRITTNIEGDDTNGSYKHSMILIGKDADGFTVYEGSINGRVRIKYYTWSDFANGYFGRHYGYFKYIKWPRKVANAKNEPAPVSCTSEGNTVEYTVGDVDNDGAVTTADARLILRSAFLLEPIEPGTAAFFAGDVDLDGMITTEDWRLVLRSSTYVASAPAETADLRETQ